MKSPKEIFELKYGKKEETFDPNRWEKAWQYYFNGWMDCWERLNLEKDERMLSDFQRGVE